MNTRIEFWSDRDYDWGWFHPADIAQAEYVPELAVIFVHGILSGPGLWKDLAPQMFCEARVEADAFALRYSAIPLRRGGNRFAINALQKAIEEKFNHNGLRDSKSNKRYRHFVFVAHSNGGLVVKGLLTKEAAATRSAIEHRLSYAQISSITLRTRLVINIAVPHEGSSAGLSGLAECCARWNIRIERFLFRRMRPFGGAPGRFGWGMNTIPLTLRRRRKAPNRALVQLEARWREFQTHLLQKQLPFPAVKELRGDEDYVAAGGQPREVSRVLTAAQLILPHRGGHLIGTFGKGMHKALADHLHRFTRKLPLIVAERTIALSHKTDCERETFELIGEDSSAAQETPSTKPSTDSTAKRKPHGREIAQQGEVFNYLLERCDEDNPAQRLFAVTGVAGVGKTRMLSRLSRVLCVEFLRFPTNRQGRRVLHISLRDLELPRSAMSVGQRLWQKLAARAFEDLGCVEPAKCAELAVEMMRGWIEFALKLAPYRETFTFHCVARMLRRNSYVLVLDGVDDFLSNHPEVKWRYFEGLLRILAKLAADGENERLVILGVRLGQSGLDRLVNGGGWHHCEVQMMTEEEAVKRFPLTKIVFDAVHEGSEGVPQSVLKEALEVLRTPLILFAIGRNSERLLRKGGVVKGTLAGILDFALSSILEQTHVRAEGKLLQVKVEVEAFDRLSTSITEAFPIVHGEVEQSIRRIDHADERSRRAVIYVKVPATTIKNVLTVVAQINYGTSEVRFSIAEVQRAAKTLEQKWSEYLRDAPDEDKDGLLAFRLISDARVLDAILKTVFQSLAFDMWNYAHSYWEDFLVARYYSLCGRYKLVDEFTGVGYLPNITGMAGQLLGTYTVSPDLIRSARNKSLNTRDPFAICNLLALCVWNLATIYSEGAFEELLECVAPKDSAVPPSAWEPLDPFSRSFVMNGICYRTSQAIIAARSVQDDSAPKGAQESVVADNRNLLQFKAMIVRLAQALWECVHPANNKTREPLCASLAWFYLTSFGRNDKLGEWPELLDTLEHMESISVVHDFEGERKQRSLQLSLCQLISLLPEMPVRAIPSVHYLYVLCVIRRAGRAVSETEALLDTVFATTSPFRGHYQSGADALSPIPGATEQLRLFQTCERIYRDPK